MANAAPAVGLLVTCLVDLFRPRVGFAAVRLLERAGCRVVVPPRQTCCGQPAYNAGAAKLARRIAADVIAAFEGVEYVVAPSGSCAAMVRRHYPALFAGDPALRRRAEAVAGRCWELTSFLTDAMGMERVEAEFPGGVTYHDACSGLRELGVRAQPRRLLSTVSGLALAESDAADVCCGFGGLFCVKYPEVSEAMADDKIDDVLATGASTLLAGDLGCLMHIAGRLSRRGAGIRVRHVAEPLAGMADGPAIGEPGRG